MSYAEHFQDMEKGIGLAHAIAEADRCLLCYDAPCSKACPAETDPATFIRKLHLRNLTGAIRTIKENNILGGACGVLCPTSQLCEKECSATGISRPIEIGRIQRFLVEYGWQTGFKVFAKPEARREKIAVVGSGPAGLSCAAELAKAGYRITVFAERGEPGGMIRFGVPAYRFDKKFLKNELQDLDDLGVEVRCKAKIEGSTGLEKLLADGYKAVFLSPGVWGTPRLIPNTENVQGVVTYTEFLVGLREERFEEFGKQITGKTVAVIGGGSVAMDCIESASKLGAKDVYLIYRRSFAQMPAQEEERLEALRLGIHFLLLNQPVDYLSDSKGKVKGVKLVRTRLGDPDASGRRKPLEIKGSEWILEVDFVIEAIGQGPDESVNWSPAVEVDKKGLIVVDPKTGRTSNGKIFAGGDIVRGPALVVEAVQDGKLAARALIKALSKA
ncbi:MAG: NAD(P)-dependent oxidoreductase [Spirochaetaceae bacterium]|nr:MAG: NAD(P)-dependent oxidoreductase [Spirochaetaceae bacterium]